MNMVQKKKWSKLFEIPKLTCLSCTGKLQNCDNIVNKIIKLENMKIVQH